MDTGNNFNPFTAPYPWDELIEDLKKQNESLWGLIRRLEKSNQELGEENHRLKGNGEGWNRNV